MRMRTIYVALVTCASIAPAALGQMPQAQLSIGPSIADLLPGSSPQQATSRTRNIVPLTPEELAGLKKMGTLAHNATVSLNKGQYVQAEAQARQSLAVPGFPNCMAEEVLAQALEAQSKDQEALDAYQVMVVDEKAGYPRVLLPYALLLLKSGHWEQALAVYNKVLPSLPDIGFHQEMAVVHDGDVMRANSRFSPDAPDPAALEVSLHIARGLVYNSTCDWTGASQNAKALAEYEKALQLAPGNGLANYYYGIGWKQLSPDERSKYGTEQQARAALLKAVKFGKGDVKAAAEKELRVALNPK